MKTQLKQSDIRYHRERLSQEASKCPLCFRTFDEVEPVLDHCHQTGCVRGALCRWCNSIEGRCFNYAVRAAGKGGALMFLERLVKYLRYHADNPSGLIHPNHGKPYRRRKRRSTRKKRSSK